MYKEFDYPEQAYKDGAEGTIMDSNGNPSKSEVLRDIGAGLGEEALRLTDLLKIKWDLPDSRSYRVIVPIKFALK